MPKSRGWAEARDGLREDRRGERSEFRKKKLLLEGRIKALALNQSHWRKDLRVKGM